MIVLPHERSGRECQIRQLQQRFEGDLALDARERRAEAEVCRPAEGEVPVVGAVNVQPVRVGESLRVAVRGPDHRHHRLSLADRLPADLHIFRGQARGVLDRAFVAQQLLDSGGDQGGVRLQHPQLLRVAQQSVSRPLPIRFVVVS